MSKIKNGGLDKYGAEAFEQQQFGAAELEGLMDNSLVIIWKKNNSLIKMLNY